MYYIFIEIFQILHIYHENKWINMTMYIMTTNTFQSENQFYY